MGLDMYIVKATPPTHDPNINYTVELMESLGYTLFPDDEMDSPAYIGLKDFAVPFNCEHTYVDYDAIMQDYDMEKSPRLVRLTQAEYTFTDGQKNVAIDCKTVENKYTFRVNKTVWAVFLESVLYWRKEYDLQQKIYDSFEGQDVLVENCGYHQLSSQQLTMIGNYDPKAKPHLFDYDEGSLFYHEWY